MKFIFYSILILLSVLSCKKEVQLKQEPNQGKILPVEEVDLKKMNIEKSINEYPAEYPGGIKALRFFLANNFDSSVIDSNDGVLTVKLRFAIEVDGSVVDVRLVESSGNIKFDNEAIRVLKRQKNWKPGKIDGQNVRSYYSIPFTMVF